MTWRSYAGIRFTVFLVALAVYPTMFAAADDGSTDHGSNDSLIQYVPLDAPVGMSQAVVVQGHALVHTTQLLPLDQKGQLIGKDSVDEQVQKVLDNLDAVLKSTGANLNQLVRVNIYALEPSTVDRVREQLNKRLDSSVWPTLTGVLTPLPHRDALVAVDAVAVAEEQGTSVTLHHCEALGSNRDFADAAVLPRGGVAYLSGVPAEGGLTVSAVDKSITGLWKMLGDLNLSPTQIVQLKVFLRPASSADEVLQKLKEYFPDEMTPPVVFVEWLAPPPVEIELLAQLPLTDTSKPNVEYYNPPEVSPMQIFSRAALVHTERQIYISGLFPIKGGGDQAQALDVFAQLQHILTEVGSDMLHMVKGTYYVSDDGSARGTDRARLWLYDRDRTPAASKCMVHGVGRAKRKMTLDMIAVSAEQ